MNDIQDVIQFLKDCRETHQVAVDHYDEGHEVVYDDAFEPDTREFHQQCVDEYTLAINVLENVWYELDEYRNPRPY